MDLQFLHGVDPGSSSVSTPTRVGGGGRGCSLHFGQVAPPAIPGSRALSARGMALLPLTHLCVANVA